MSYEKYHSYPFSKKELNNIFYTDFYFTTSFKLKHFENYR